MSKKKKLNPNEFAIKELELLQCWLQLASLPAGGISETLEDYIQSLFPELHFVTTVLSDERERMNATKPGSDQLELPL